MHMTKTKIFFLSVIIAMLWSCSVFAAEPVILGDERIDEYLPKIFGKRVALFCNHTAVIGQEHLLDMLLRQGQQVTILFAAEHGIRGEAAGGKVIENGTDPVSGIFVASLYDGSGITVRPTAETMEKFDVLVIDIQDVGVRYYTYYITMCDLLESCSRYDKEIILLDRPNPNGHYVDGPILDKKFMKNYVGRFPIPVVHGLTLGELALMAIGEGWLNLLHAPKLTVIPCRNYTHSTPYELPIPPSPNLPNMKAIYLYPSLCPFEGTAVSVGRGTSIPFQCFGHPYLKKKYHYCFIPQSTEAAPHPLLQGQLCYGVNFSQEKESKLINKGLDLTCVIETYKIFKAQGRSDEFFGDEIYFGGLKRVRYFDLLMGQSYVREAVTAGKNAKEIKSMWQNDVNYFIRQRRPYLLYEE